VLSFDSVQKQHEFLLEDHLTVAWRDGCSPWKMRSFHEIQMPQHIRITICIKREVFNWSLKLSIASKASAWCGTFNPRRFQQALAKVQCRKRCSMVSSQVSAHKTQSKEGKVISHFSLMRYSTLSIWLQYHSKPSLSAENQADTQTDGALHLREFTVPDQLVCGPTSTCVRTWTCASY